MTISRAISSALLTLGLFTSSLSFAQGGFNVDDASALSGYRGYSNYREGREQLKNPDKEDETFYSSSISEERRSYPYEGGAEEKHPYTLSNKNEASRIEEFYRHRAKNDTLTQFGYDMFYTKSHLPNEDEHARPMGAVADDYIIQSGDEIIIRFTGERKGQEKYQVGSDGRLLIDSFVPIMAMGRALSDVKNEINLMIENSHYLGSVDVSVGAMRQIGVSILGYVNEPGRHNLNAYHSVMDALNIAAGVRKNGSLRNIKLIRNGFTQQIDLYKEFGIVFGQNDVVLQDGDRIVVPPLGDTFSVVGDVRQEGVFELLGNTKTLLSHALDMAGGLMGNGDYSYSLIHDGGEIVDLSRGSMVPIDNGSILRVSRASDRLDDGVELRGYSRRNGFYGLGVAGTLKSLFDNGRIFGDDIYPLVGVISRTDRDGLVRKLMAFSPQSVVKNGDDRQLESGDVVYLFSNDDIDGFLNYNDKKENKNNGKNEFPKNIVDFVLGQFVRINGAVANEGSWPVGTVVDLKTLVAVAGGFLSSANPNNIEIVAQADFGKGRVRRKISQKNQDLSSVILEPGDQVRVNENFEKAVHKTVRITGEVKNPGAYDLMRGDQLSSLIARAGGLTDDAYAPAAVFSRKAERKREEQKFRNAAQELERTVSINLNAKDQNASLTPAQISMARKLADDLRSVQAIGRVTVEADPVVLSLRPELDMLLEDGDHLHIPKRTLNVRVTGEVMNPVSLLFTEDKDVSDYIRGAGGKTYYADSGRMFVVYPDGSAEPVSGGHDKIIPGSTIIIPRDPKPFDFIESFKDITQILTNMAITGVFVEDIATDEN